MHCMMQSGVIHKVASRGYNTKNVILKDFSLILVKIDIEVVSGAKCNRVYPCV